MAQPFKHGRSRGESPPPHRERASAARSPQLHFRTTAPAPLLSSRPEHSGDLIRFLRKCVREICAHRDRERLVRAGVDWDRERRFLKAHRPCARTFVSTVLVYACPTTPRPARVPSSTLAPLSARNRSHSHRRLHSHDQMTIGRREAAASGLALVWTVPRRRARHSCRCARCGRRRASAGLSG